eukprot:884930-Rhodomonas_salina.6
MLLRGRVHRPQLQCSLPTYPMMLYNKQHCPTICCYATPSTDLLYSAMRATQRPVLSCHIMLRSARYCPAI